MYIFCTQPTGVTLQLFCIVVEGPKGCPFASGVSCMRLLEGELQTGPQKVNEIFLLEMFVRRHNSTTLRV